MRNILLATGFALVVAAAVAGADKETATDDLQRSRMLDTYKVVAESGAGRGENI